MGDKKLMIAILGVFKLLAGGIKELLEVLLFKQVYQYEFD